MPIAFETMPIDMPKTVLLEKVFGIAEFRDSREDF
jgi:hypothetical protein